MCGRGASSSIPEVKPSGGRANGGGGNRPPLDENPGPPSTLNEALGKKGRPMSTYDAVMKANPFYDRSYGEYSENCQRAIIATEARFRGYDVIASPTYDGDKMPLGDKWKESFNGAKTNYVGRSTPAATQKTLEAKMAEYGNGARAVVQVQWKGRNASGHVLTAVQRNGKTYYYDGQIGAKFNGKDLFNVVRTKAVELTRVDNLNFANQAKEAVRQNPYRKK